MKLSKIFRIFTLAFAAAFAVACARDNAEPGAGPGAQEGTLLNLSVGVGQMSTRLTELGSAGDMMLTTINGKDYGLSHVGLYIYYTSDYKAGNLGQPYIRNLKCEIKDGNKLVPVIEPGQLPSDADIYIYDDMTIVAFYPYNGEMSLEENYFNVKGDEDNYYITRNDYVEQHFIPYRAETTTNPTISYYTELWFFPRHTYKVEIVVVSDDEGDFVAADDVIILPNIDPLDTPDEDLDTEGRRAKWYDDPAEYTNRTGGSNVRKYTSYIWTKERGDNDIPRGEILLQAGKLTLIASQDVPVQQQHVYRYGYNMSTGEIFIPTSSNLIWDAESLAGYSGGDLNGYQVCDIDLADYGLWTPTTISRGRFDGGGHKISNMEVNSAGPNAGLFGKISNNASICNINLVDPVVTVNSPTPVNVGALCGQVSDVLSEEEMNAYLAGLPENLSPVVKAAIIADLLADALNSTCRVAGCRVENPVITVNAPAPKVGTICGTAGAVNDDEDSFKAVIWSTYSLGGSITVNAGNEADNAGGYVGGFCGLNNGRIFGSYTTIDEITFRQDNGGTLEDDYTGFTTMGDLFTSSSDAGVTDDFAVLDDPNVGNGVSLMPGIWPGWSSGTPWWPVLTSGWLDSETLYWYDAGSPPDNYPVLQWERR